jgi:hypothetical protein
MRKKCAEEVTSCRITAVAIAEVAPKTRTRFGG